MKVTLTLGHIADPALPGCYVFEEITYPLRRVNKHDGESPLLVAPVRLGELLLERKEAGEKTDFPDIDYYATDREFSLPDEELVRILQEPRLFNDSLPQLHLLAEDGLWRERAIDILQFRTAASYEEIVEFVNEYWENLKPDAENIESFHERMGNGSNREKELLAFAYPINRFKRDATDEEIIAGFEADDDEEEPVLCYTPDELAERLNDDDIGFTEHWIRFIEY